MPVDYLVYWSVGWLDAIQVAMKAYLMADLMEKKQAGYLEY